MLIPPLVKASLSFAFRSENILGVNLFLHLYFIIFSSPLSLPCTYRLVIFSFIFLYVSFSLPFLLYASFLCIILPIRFLIFHISSMLLLFFLLSHLYLLNCHLIYTFVILLFVILPSLLPLASSILVLLLTSHWVVGVTNCFDGQLLHNGGGGGRESS